MKDIKKIIVIGASAGGLRAIGILLSTFHTINDIAVFVVLHVAKHSITDVLVHTFEKNTSLNCKIPSNGDLIEMGSLYIAPPDRHLIISGNAIKITSGPPENRWRPSIDVLFRSAAANYDGKVIGIILTGLLDDGTSGMSAIKRSGGIAIVQEPEEAEFSDMPQSVLNNVDVDFRVPIADMGYIIADLILKPAEPAIAVPEDVKIEAKITERVTSSIEDMMAIGKHTVFICPDCGGGLWELNKDKNIRYRCHSGHVYTESVLLNKQAEGLEETLWVAVRMMEERRNLLKIAASHQTINTGSNTAKDNRIDEIEIHINRIKEVLYSLKDKDLNATNGLF